MDVTEVNEQRAHEVAARALLRHPGSRTATRFGVGGSEWNAKHLFTVVYLRALRGLAAVVDLLRLLLDAILPASAVVGPDRDVLARTSDLGGPREVVGCLVAAPGAPSSALAALT